MVNINPYQIRLAEFRKFLFDTVVPLDDIVDHAGKPMIAALRNWRKVGLAPFIPEGSHKVNISFSDLLWLRILDNLRQFGFPVQKQYLVADYFFKDAYDHELPKKNFLYNRDQLVKKKTSVGLNQEEEQLLRDIERLLRDDKYLYVLRFELNYLTNLVIDCIESGEDRGIAIFIDGRVGEQHGDFLYNHRFVPVDRRDPHLYFSIHGLLQEFLSDPKYLQRYMPQVLTNEEQLLVKEMDSQNLLELNVTGQEGVVLIEKKGEEIGADDRHRVKQALCNRQYHCASFVTKNRSRHYFERPRRTAGEMANALDSASRPAPS